MENSAFPLKSRLAPTLSHPPPIEGSSIVISPRDAIPKSITTDELHTKIGSDISVSPQPIPPKDGPIDTSISKGIVIGSRSVNSRMTIPPSDAQIGAAGCDVCAESAITSIVIGSRSAKPNAKVTYPGNSIAEGIQTGDDNWSHSENVGIVIGS
jgi:hypothetical protein